MRILIYILEYLMVGTVTTLTCDRLRDRYALKKCVEYNVLDVVLWPIVWITWIFGVFIVILFSNVKGS